MNAAKPERVLGDDDLVSIEDFHLVLPVHPRTPYAWEDFTLTPDVEFPAGKLTRRAWRVGRLREWYDARPDTKAWRTRVTRAAKDNVVPEHDVPMTDEIRRRAEWIEGLDAGTEELIVRIVRPREGTTA